MPCHPRFTLLSGLLLPWLLLSGQPAWAVIYKYVDAEGNVTFTDKYRPGAKRLTEGNGGPVTRVETPRRAPRASASKASPADFPRVDPTTQRKRDDVRRTILLEERATEARNLAAAQTAAGKALPPAEQARVAESIRLHEKNLELLDKELARLK